MGDMGNRGYEQAMAKEEGKKIQVWVEECYCTWINEYEVSSTDKQGSFGRVLLPAQALLTRPMRLPPRRHLYRETGGQGRRKCDETKGRVGIQSGLASASPDAQIISQRRQSRFCRETSRPTPWRREPTCLCPTASLCNGILFHGSWVQVFQIRKMNKQPSCSIEYCNFESQLASL